MIDYFAYINNFAIYKNVKSVLVLGQNEKRKLLITIAIPTFRRPKLLERALISAINQIGDLDYEIIIVDNDFNDKETESVVRKHLKSNVFYYKNCDNIGMFGNWNRCIELATGEYITILNDDDWLSKDFILNCNRYLNIEIDGLYFPSNRVDLRNNTKQEDRDYSMLVKILISLFSKEQKKLELFDFLLGNRNHGTLGILIKTEKLRKLGGYNPNFYPSSDYILHSIFCFNYNVLNINIKLNYYGIEDNASGKQETMEKWASLDYEFRECIIQKLKPNSRLMPLMNEIITEMRIDDLISNWSYDTSYEFKYNILRKLFVKLLGLKFLLNI